jgi:hypothetical protein
MANDVGHLGPSVCGSSTQRYLTALSSFVLVSQRVNIVCYRHLLSLLADTPSRKHVDHIFHRLCWSARACNAICVCRTESHFFLRPAKMRRSALVAATDGVAGHSLMKLLQPCRLIKDVWLRDTSGPPAFARLGVSFFFPCPFDAHSIRVKCCFLFVSLCFLLYSSESIALVAGRGKRKR